MTGYYFDRDGNEISLERWGELAEDSGYRIVGHSTFDDGSLLSTVWLGLNHNSFGDSLHIFETAFFPPEERPAIIFSRASTEDEAKAQHMRALMKFGNTNGRNLITEGNIDVYSSNG